MKIQRIEPTLQRLQADLAALWELMTAKQTAVAALDTTMLLIHRGIEPSAAGVVHAWAGKYGRRGALNAFLLQTIRDAAPASVTTSALLEIARSHFGLVLVSVDSRKKFRDVLKTRLMDFQRLGLIEPLHDKRTRSSGIWRWKQPPTLADLVVQAAAMREAPADGLLRNPEGRTDAGNQTGASLGNGPADTDTARREVDAQ